MAAIKQHPVTGVRLTARRRWWDVDPHGQSAYVWAYRTGEHALDATLDEDDEIHQRNDHDRTITQR